MPVYLPNSITLQSYLHLMLGICLKYSKNTVHVAGLPPHSVKPSARTASKILLLVGLWSNPIKVGSFIGVAE